VAAGCGKSSHTTGAGAGGVAPDSALAMNVHPLGGGAVGLQRAAIARLGLRWIRVTLGLVSETTAARPYVGLGPRVLGLVSDFNLGTLEPAAWLDLLDGTLRRYPDVQAAELLNEPEHTVGLDPATYVRSYLQPGFELVRDRYPGVAVVCAAPVGDPRKAPDRFRRMTDAGADRFCDFRAVHAYFADEASLGAIRAATGRPILVTETGTAGAADQVRWYTEVVPRLRQVLGAELLFWYVLLEGPTAYPGFSLIASTPGPDGQPRAAPGSGLYGLLTRPGPTAERPGRR
jgi:hypothetical protein